MKTPTNNTRRSHFGYSQLNRSTKTLSNVAALLLCFCTLGTQAAPPTITSINYATIFDGNACAIDVNATDDIDSDFNGLTYAISGGVDQEDFTIDANTGVVHFLLPAGAANPKDINLDNHYGIEVSVTDTSGESATQAITITVAYLPGPARTWYIDNLEFDTGAVASGSFRYDPNPASGQFGAFSLIDVKVTKDGITTNYTSTAPASGGNSGYLALITQETGDLTGTPYLGLTLEGAMTSAGGELNVLPGPHNLSYQGFCSNPDCTANVSAPYDEANAGGRILAGPRTWKIDNLTFDTGAVASGTFTFDPDTGSIANDANGNLYYVGTFSNINIQTTKNGNTVNYIAVSPTMGSNDRNLSLVTLESGDLTGTPLLSLELGANMTALGGVVPILEGPQFLAYQGICDSPGCSFGFGPYDESNGGSISTNPGTQTWFIEAVRFDTGEVLNGSFDYDANLGVIDYIPGGGTIRSGVFSNINITSTRNGSDVHYVTTNPGSDGNQSYLGLVTIDGVDLTGTPLLSLTLDGKMTEVSGPLAILPGPQSLSYQGQCKTASCGQNAGPYSEVLVGGRVTRNPDLSPPTAAPTFTPAPNAAGWNNTDVEITWNWTDGADGSGLNPNYCPASFLLNLEWQGAFVGFCDDLVGLLGSYVAIVNIDKTSPETMLTSAPPVTNSGQNVSFLFSGLDTLSGIAGFECELTGPGNTAGYLPCTDSQTYSDLEAGSYQFSVRAIDLAGNADQSPVEFLFTVQAGSDSDGDGVFDAVDNCRLKTNPQQTDTDGYGNACDADFNNDCIVNFLDFSLFANAFMGSDLVFDINSDSNVNFLDYHAVTISFQNAPGPGLGTCSAQ